MRTTRGRDYRWSDRALHRLAFRSAAVQIALADAESMLFRDRLRGVELDRPAFITALPRAGTTIVLRLLVQSGHFASHTYEDMPFVFCPMIWHEFAHRLRTYDAPRERAHEDGIGIDLSSPEAFEEMLWKHFWPKHYRDEWIEPWDSCEAGEFLEFLTSHMKKIVALRGRDSPTALRYLSKNNMNIARLRCLPRAIPGARIVVLFRDPLQHAQSLCKQHRGFLALHRQDGFAREYMEGLGHHDFGANLRPVNFGDWLETDERECTVGLGFWLKYWNATYTAVRASLGAGVQLLSYDQLARSPEAGLAWLATFMEMSDPEALVRQSGALHPPPCREIRTDGISSDVLEEALDLYQDMERLAMSAGA